MCPKSSTILQKKLAAESSWLTAESSKLAVIVNGPQIMDKIKDQHLNTLYIIIIKKILSIYLLKKECSVESFHEAMMEYKRQMQLGVIPRAYRGIMEYMLGLKAYLLAEYPAYNVSSSIYFGYMDMSYFSFFPDSLQHRKLKTGIVFIHETCQFEAWFFGLNKQVQKQYWQLIKDSGWDQSTGGYHPR